MQGWSQAQSSEKVQPDKSMYIKYVHIEFDSSKREKTLAERGLDFARAGGMRKANDREQARFSPLG